MWVRMGQPFAAGFEQEFDHHQRLVMAQDAALRARSGRQPVLGGVGLGCHVAAVTFALGVLLTFVTSGARLSMGLGQGRLGDGVTCAAV